MLFYERAIWLWWTDIDYPVIVALYTINEEPRRPGALGLNGGLMIKGYKHGSIIQVEEKSELLISFCART